jgi:hypothetical protein
MIAAIYARKGSDLYGSLVTAWRWVDWTAVSSLATLAAVIVALMPIVIEWRWRGAIADGLRTQLLIR